MGSGLWMKYVASLLIVSAPLAIAGCQRSGAGSEQRWASMPHTMGCRQETGDLPAGPSSAQIRQMRFSFAGGQRLQLDVQFAGPPPPEEPRVLNTHFGPIDAPGTVSMSFLIHPMGINEEKVIVVESPTAAVKQGWRADTSEFDSANPDILESVSTNGSIRTFVLDLSRLDRQLGPSPFQADVSVVTMVNGQPGNGGTPNLFPVKGSDCLWETAPLTDGQPGGGPSKPSPSTAHSSVVQPPPAAPPVVAPTIPVAGADTRGFVQYPEVRCDSTDRAAMVMRTTQSLVVVCRQDDGTLYYEGMRLSDSAAIRLDGARSTPKGYSVINPADGTRYELSQQGLAIIVDGNEIASEDALESAFL